MAETVEETFETEVRRKVTRTAFKIEEVSWKLSSIVNVDRFSGPESKIVDPHLYRCAE